MKGKKAKKGNLKARIWIVSTVIALMFSLGGYFIVNVLISDKGGKRERQIHMVTLLKPPPLPEIEELPPEPEIEEEVIEEELDMPNEDLLNDGEDMTDPGESLGLDADGVAGSDGFGLVSNKGGKALIGGDMGNSALLRKFAWYTQIIQDRIREHIQKQLDEEGGIPDGKLEATVRIVLDERGQIKAFKIIDSSGSPNMDTAINVALKQVDIDMPPPYDMPRSIKIKVSSKG